MPGWPCGSQPNVFLILSIPHHQSLPSDSNHTGEHTRTRTFRHAHRRQDVYTLHLTQCLGVYTAPLTILSYVHANRNPAVATQRNYQPSTFFTQANRRESSLIPKVKHWGDCISKSQPWITFWRCKHGGKLKFAPNQSETCLCILILLLSLRLERHLIFPLFHILQRGIQSQIYGKSFFSSAYLYGSLL